MQSVQLVTAYFCGCGKRCASAKRQCGSQQPHLDVCVGHLHAALQCGGDLRQPRRQRPERVRGFHQVGGHGVAPALAVGNSQQASIIIKYLLRTWQD